MVILELYQNNYSKDLVVFETIEEGKEFVAKIPGYTLEKEDSFEVEYFNPKNLPDYMEIVFNGNIVPLSRFSFNPEENVDIIWKEISNLSVKNDKVIEGATKVDAYVVNNGEAIVFRKKDAEDWHFLCHLEPSFIEIKDVEGYVKEAMEEMQ